MALVLITVSAEVPKETKHAVAVVVLVVALVEVVVIRVVLRGMDQVDQDAGRTAVGTGSVHSCWREGKSVDATSRERGKGKL